MRGVPGFGRCVGVVALALMLVVGGGGGVVVPGSVVEASTLWSPAPPSSWVPESDMRLDVPVGETISGTQTSAVDTSVFSRYAFSASSPFHVAVISSGVEVDADLFPASAFAGGIESFVSRPDVSATLPSGGSISTYDGDSVGYGTYAASILFQQSMDARIVSYPVYPQGRFSPELMNAVLDELCLRKQGTEAKKVDAILFAMPPSDVLDPVSASMAVRPDAANPKLEEWDYVAETIGVDWGVEATDPFGGRRWPKLSQAQNAARRVFDANKALWATAVSKIRCLSEQHRLPVVVSAGDLGDAPQSILGLANLAEVITVGASDGVSVSGSSGAGPSLQGLVKPDLVGPSGMTALLPKIERGTALVSALKDKDVLLSQDPNDDDYDQYNYDPFGWTPAAAADARARLDTSLTPATLVAGTLAAMVDGAAVQLTVTQLRGGLRAAAVPLSGVPVWRQGAGYLMRALDDQFVDKRVLAFGDASLGAEPESGVWQSQVTTGRWSSGTEVATAVDAATTALDDHIGATPFGENELLSAEPDYTTGLVAGVLTIAGTVGDAQARAGVFCGFVRIDLPLIGGGLTDDVPDGHEDVETCLMETTTIVARALYLHNESAENLTFGLVPGIVPGKNIYEDQIMQLPQEVEHTPPRETDPMLYRAVTTDVLTRGHAKMEAVLPGYYKVRLWADYSSKVCEDGSNTCAAPRDLGANPHFQEFEATVLPRPQSCPEKWQEGASAGDPHPDDQTCREDWLKTVVSQTVGKVDVAVEYEDEDASGGWLLGPSTLGAERLRVVIGFTRRLVGASVMGRYMDLVECEDLETVSEVLGPTVPPLITDEQWIDLDDIVPLGWECVPDSTGSTSVAWSEHLGSTAKVGARFYEFALPQPNYRADLSINFSYEITNGFLLVVGQAGPEQCIAAVTSAGTVQLYPPAPEDPINVGNPWIWGHAVGKANLFCPLTPYNAPTGILAIYAITAPGWQTSASVGIIGEVSFEAFTWSTELWPAKYFYDDDGSGQLKNPGDDKDGHLWYIASNFSARLAAGNGQISPKDALQQRKRRDVVTDELGTVRTLTEDWLMLIHSPIANASTFDIADQSGDISQPATSIRTDLQGDSREGYFNPANQVSDFTDTSIGRQVTLNGLVGDGKDFKTNNRFWEHILIPIDVLEAHPKILRMCIQDHMPRLEGQSTSLPVAPCEATDILEGDDLGSEITVAPGTSGAYEGWRALELTVVDGHPDIPAWYKYDNNATII